MEKKNNNGIIIVLMGVIIIILLILCVLFATDTIVLNNETGKINDSTTDEVSDETNTQTNNILNSDQAKNIVKELFENDIVRIIMDNSQFTYCNNVDNTKSYTEKELGLNYEGNGFSKCNSYNSYEDVMNEFKQYFTDEYFNNNLLGKRIITTKSYTNSNGTIMYNYYEKDGGLYIAFTGKGGDISKHSVKEFNYTVNSIDEDTIDTTVNAVWLDPDSNETTEIINISLKKVNDIWKIDSYNIK